MGLEMLRYIGNGTSKRSTECNVDFAQLNVSRRHVCASCLMFAIGNMSSIKNVSLSVLKDVLFCMKRMCYVIQLN